MRTSRAILGGIVLALGAATAVLGRQAAQTSAPPSQGQPTFRGGTTVVEVDVIVRDKVGRFVGDLRAEDFEVRDEGTPVEISAVYRVIGPGDQSAGAPAERPPLPAPPPRQVQRVVIFFFDQAHVQPGGFDKARKAALGFLQKDFREGDVGGVVSGGTMVNNRLSSSRKELEAAMTSIKPAPQTSTITRELRDWPRFVDIIEAFRVTRHEPGFNPGPTVLDDVTARACRDRPDDCSGPAGRALVEGQCQNKATELVTQGRIAGKQTIDTISALANGLARLPGRKTIILMTEGFFVEDAWADLRAVIGRAARASVRIYALDTRGLNRGSASSDIFTAAAPSPEMSAPDLGDTNADGPNSLAVDTGGYVIRNENDFGKAFAEIDRDTSSYYIVGFRTSRPPDGKFHAINVSVKRSGVLVRARKGYVASPELALPEAADPVTKAVVPAAPGSGAVSLPTPVAPAAAPGAAGTTPPAAPAATSRPGVEPLAARAMPRVSEQVDELTAMTGNRSNVSVNPPDTLVRQARSGWEAYEKGDLEAARVALGAAAAQPSAPPWVHYTHGWTLYAAFEYAAAGTAWEQVRSAVPEFEPVYFDLADSYLQQREFAKAVVVLRGAQSRWPKDVEVYNALGVIQLARGTVDDAIATFEQAVAVGPTNANACYNLAKTYEVRFVRAERLGKVGPGAISPAAARLDRDRALDNYRQVILLGGPMMEAAKEGVKRLGGF